VLGQKSATPSTEEEEENSDYTTTENSDADNTPEPSENYGA
jgi:hypothetical protein